MKKLAKRVSLFMLALTLSTAGYAATETTSTKGTEIKGEPLTEAESKTLVSRLEEIKEIDKSELNKEEKKALRKEVKEIKRDLKGNGGIYLSTGAIIIIVLLLIILL